jgi:GT2 family glycosyltransferase
LNDSKVRLSIIIVSWNTKELLRQCLESVYRSGSCEDVEVIVVDNASSDGSAEMVLQSFPTVTLIQNEANLGFAAANNQGFKVCSGNLILLLNSDTRVLDGALQKCMDYMDRRADVGVLGCRVLNPDGSFQSSYFRFERIRDLIYFHWLGISFWFSMLRRFGLKTINYPSRYWGKVFTREKDVDVVAGCFFMTRRRVMDAVGALDESFYFYGEEEEWCHRIKHAGWAIVYFPFAEIFHIHGASSKLLKMSLDLAGVKARLLVLEKTRGFMCAWLGNLVMTLGLLLRIPVWFIGKRQKFRQQNNGQNQTSHRFQLVQFHLNAMRRPVWRPAAKSAE